MVRTFIILLLLAVFFLSGTHYGMNQGNDTAENEVTKDNEVVSISDNPGVSPESEITVSQTANEDVMDMENNVHLTNNAASFLETSVQGFFEIVVGILYQITEIFF